MILPDSLTPIFYSRNSEAEFFIYRGVQDDKDATPANVTVSLPLKGESVLTAASWNGKAFALAIPLDAALSVSAKASAVTVSSAMQSASIQKASGGLDKAVS